ncbi:MAG: FAD-dependent oxidoreductase, partial [Planctomycetota bacterium]
MPETVVIIGAGAAGVSALESFRRIDRATPVTIISAELMPRYSLCALPYLLSKALPYKRFPRLSETFYKEMRARTIFGNRVCKINPSHHSIALESGKTIFYHKLLIATGSVPLIPPVDGIDKQGVFVMDNLRNTRRIINYINKHRVKQAAVIGAGFTGIETALSLNKIGIGVIIIELLDRVLARILDHELANIAFQLIENAHISIKLNARLIKITSPRTSRSRAKERVNGILYSITEQATATPPRQTEADVQMTIISVGVAPNTSFLKDSGIVVNRGIVVNEHMQTDINDIYAAGDVAEVWNGVSGQRQISAIWHSAVEQGLIAGENLADKSPPSSYQGACPINILNINSTPIVSIGTIPASHPNTQTLTYRTDRATRRLFINDNNR